VASIITMLAGSPVVNINWFTLLLAILAPIAWPVHRSTSARDQREFGGRSASPRGCQHLTRATASACCSREFLRG
jgi:hypothetical protein